MANIATTRQSLQSALGMNLPSRGRLDPTATIGAQSSLQWMADCYTEVLADPFVADTYDNSLLIAHITGKAMDKR